jgi:hypothetical protein
MGRRLTHTCIPYVIDAPVDDPTSFENEQRRTFVAPRKGRAGTHRVSKIRVRKSQREHKREETTHIRWSAGGGVHHMPKWAREWISPEWGEAH